jgi:hypothetical protein
MQGTPNPPPSTAVSSVSRTHRNALMVTNELSEAAVHCVPETCGSGLTGTPGERVTSQEVQGFESLRLRRPAFETPQSF